MSISAETKKKWLVKLLGAVLIVFVLGLIHAVIPHFYHTVAHYVWHRDVQGLSTYIASFGYGAVGLCMLLIVMVNAVGFPSIQFLTLNGLVFGVGPGIVISWIGEVIGIEIAFFFMRTLFRGEAKKIIQKSSKLQKLDSHCNMRTIMLGRAIPYTPNVALTALSALSRISYKDHFLANIAGKLPSVCVEVWLGHDLLQLHEHWQRFCILLVCLLAGYVVVYWVKRHKVKPMTD